MPCWDSYLYAKELKEKQCEKHQDECSDIKCLELKIHKLTEMLCSLCKRVESAWPTVFVEERELGDWWRNHKSDDQVIKEIEEMRSMKKQLEDLEERISIALKK